MPEGGIDLGEAVAQQLAIALDPFPRAPGVVFTTVDDEESTAQSTDMPTALSPRGADIEDKGEIPSRPNPFAVLSKLKK